MPIESGKHYHVVNKKAKKPIDLDIRNNKTVHCWTQHEGTNQQWEFIRVAEGWHIKNVQQRTYLGFEGDPGDGKKVECLYHEHIWHIWEDQIVPDGYRICVPNTKQNLDLADHGNQADGTIVQLWTSWEGLNQVWVVKEVGSDE